MKDSGELSRRISEFLGPRGYFAHKLPNYEHRPEQITMAREVLCAFQGARFLIVEAGTGTGKTFAYLVPALLSGQKVVISSGTKNLQEQIFFKDLPALARQFKFRATLMKGRSNYLCWYKYRNFLREPMFPFRKEIQAFKSIERWVTKTRTGDRAEIPDLPDDYATWREISATSEQCLGTKCPDFKQCFITRMRQEAQESDILIVNHHLFFADLSVRESGFGEVIPRYRTVIFDETHQLEDVATEYFGFQVSDFRIEDLARDMLRSLPVFIPDKPRQKGFQVELEKMRNLSKIFFRAVAALAGARLAADVRHEDEGRRFLLEDDDLSGQIKDQGLELCRALKDLSARLSGFADKDAVPANLKERSEKISKELAFILKKDNPDFVYWCETRPRSHLLRASPLEIGPTLQDSLYTRLDTAVFTSATLATSQNNKWSFEYIKSRLGLDDMGSRVEELKLESSFDFQDQTVLYLPLTLPEPDDRKFIEAAALEMEELVKISRGRAFLLFTSFRNMYKIYEILSKRLDFPLLRQGQSPRTVLLDEFRKTDCAVLFATASFWQGVDVIGPALSLVVVDKLPFAPPSDPLVAARITRINELRGNAFHSYQVPAAVIALKQGLGRLIRSRNDFGILAVLDTRIRRRGYGRVFLASLPAMRITDDLGELRDFFKGKERSRTG
jgi:ATP-dependent DNA helicase DinG